MLTRLCNTLRAYLELRHLGLQHIMWVTTYPPVPLVATLLTRVWGSRTSPCPAGLPWIQAPRAAAHHVGDHLPTHQLLPEAEAC